jgi:putative transcriptional regulator
MNESTQLAKSIAGEITLAKDCGGAFRKWRQIFEVSQKELSEKLGVNPSVLSDYESGRRKTPGTAFVKRFVEKLIDIDAERGGQITKKMSPPTPHEAIADIREFKSPISAETIVKTVRGKTLTKTKPGRKSVRGYTIIDSIQAIQTLSANDFGKIYGATTERALVFTKVRYGRSPMIALKVTTPKPSMVVLHGPTPSEVDRLAVRIAETENIQLVVSNIKDERELIQNLKGVNA